MQPPYAEKIERLDGYSGPNSPAHFRAAYHLEAQGWLGLTPRTTRSLRVRLGSDEKPEKEGREGLTISATPIRRLSWGYGCEASNHHSGCSACEAWKRAESSILIHSCGIFPTPHGGLPVSLGVRVQILGFRLGLGLRVKIKIPLLGKSQNSQRLKQEAYGCGGALLHGGQSGPGRGPLGPVAAWDRSAGRGPLCAARATCQKVEGFSSFWA